MFLRKKTSTKPKIYKRFQGNEKMNTQENRKSGLNLDKRIKETPLNEMIFLYGSTDGVFICGIRPYVTSVNIKANELITYTGIAIDWQALNQDLANESIEDFVKKNKYVIAWNNPHEIELYGFEKQDEIAEIEIFPDKIVLYRPHGEMEILNPQ